MQLKSEDLVRITADYYKFFNWLWPSLSTEKLVENWHIRYICDELNYLSRFIVNREKPPYHTLIINVPPGSTKSTLITQCFPVWLWMRDPSIKTIISTHSDRLSVKHSLNAHNVIDSIEWKVIISEFIEKLHGKPFRITKDTEKEWHNNYGGMYYATSTGGSVTGEHAHLQIWDDPQTPEMVSSEAKRDASNRFYEHTMPTRRIDKDKTPVIIVMQRLHEDDVCGRRIGNPGVKHICLPAEDGANVRPPEARKSYVNGLLDPVRLSQEVIRQQKIELGSTEYACQYEQDPRPEGGNIVQETWFRRCPLSAVPYGITNVWIDGAYTDQTKNDPTGLMAARFVNGTLYILDFSEEWMEMPGLLNHVPGYAERHRLTNLSRIYLEPKASGKSLRQMLHQQTHYNVIEIVGSIVSSGKMARLQQAAPRIEAGRVVLVEGSWNEKYIYQLTTFPNAKHDEACDLTGYACHYHFNKRSGIKRQN